jgi:hypothetical protein
MLHRPTVLTALATARVPIVVVVVEETNMPEIKMLTAYRVDIIESERGWGQRIDEIKYFDNEAEAREFCRKYNAQNDKPYVPDWYMRADYVGKIG